MPLRRYFTLLVCLPLIAVGACREIVDPPLPDGTTPFTPPSYYTTWWAMTTACSGVTGNPQDLHWFVVPSGTSIVLDGAQLSGYWSEASNRIVLRDDATNDGAVVRHEMLHALIRVGGHPRQYFVDRCGGTVDCVTACMADAGPPPTLPPSTPALPADSFDIAVFVTDTTASSANGGYFSVTVTATNRAPHQVTAALPPSGDASGDQVAFGFLLESESGQGSTGSVIFDQVLTTSEVLSFAPGETKRQVFDLFARGPNLRAGSYRVTGSFGFVFAPPHPLTIVP
jgi:hypothetical protein